MPEPLYLTTDRGVPARPAALIVPGGREDLLTLTRVIVGLVRQIAHDQYGTVQNAIAGKTLERPWTVERVAELGRAIVRKEFMDDADINRYALKVSQLPDDVPNDPLKGKAGDYEVTAHPISSERLAELRMRESSTPSASAGSRGAIDMTPTKPGSGQGDEPGKAGQSGGGTRQETERETTSRETTRREEGGGESTESTRKPGQGEGEVE